MLTDVSGSRTIGSNYDLLGRPGCIQNATPTINATGACSAGNPYVQNTYDVTKLGTQGSTDFPVGRLTQSIATTYFPESTSATATEKMQYDQRGRLITAQLALGLPSSWNVTTALPTYQVAVAYNDANQVTTTTTSTNPAGQGYTTTQVYDSTTGALSGLSNNGTATANLATLLYNARAQLDTINFQTSTGSALAADQFGYDANLRPTSTSATWGSGSGSSGTILSQSRSYDNASNVISLSTTQAAVPGQSGSGGSETQNFCYDEQNRLVWAGNSGTQPGAGNGTCGSGTLSNTLSGASYSNSYVYTHLGQLWRGPLAGGSTQYQYLYCGSSQPHQLTGLYPLGTTCSTKSGQVYTSSYDAWGNVTTRYFSGTTATLSYDLLDHFTEWNAGATNQEWYVYDASGQRVLRRTINSTSTTLRVYAFGLEEHTYGGTGTNQGNTYYYSLGGYLLGALDGNGTRFYLTDALGSILSNITNAAGGASIKGNQVFGPYGNARYFKGSINTAKGFTGQYNDSLTGLDYYNVRYYDPKVGVFLSADTVQGNGSGENPYAYVGGNPETSNDPTGNDANPIAQFLSQVLQNPWLMIAAAVVVSPAGAGAFFLIGISIGIMLSPSGSHGPATGPQPVPAPTPTHTPPPNTGCCVLSLAPHISGAAISIQPHNNAPPTQTGSGGRGMRPPIPTGTAASPQPCSFTPDTPVTTDHGEQAIGKLHIGEKVLAYNPKTHKMEQQPIVHVWTHTDNDLVDLTITASTPVRHGKPAPRTSEVVHTNKEHPFFTMEQGFLPVARITVGMHILQADGSGGVVTGWKIVPGTKLMYNLEVAQDHTFTVGDGQWVVHNACIHGSKHSPDEVSSTVRNLAALTDEARAESGTVRMQRGGRSTPNFAAIDIDSPDINLRNEVFKSLRSENNGDPYYDAEQLAVRWAIDRLNEFSASGIQTDYDVTLVTQYWPCEFCQLSIDTRSWLTDLRGATNGGVRLQIWHYMDNGMFERVIPGRP